MTVRMFHGMGYDSNVYLLMGDSPILVDTGTGMHTKELLREIEAATDPRAIRTIVLTHRHYDHVGGAAALAEILDAKVCIHELDAAPVRDGSSAGTGATMFGQTIRRVSVDVLRGGEMLSTGHGRYRVVHTPGHTAGGISLFNEDDRTLLSGDTVFAGGVGRWDMPTGSRRQLVDSVRKLLALRPRDLYPGHGPCSQGDAEKQIEEALIYLGEY